jgi:hypothetical protein
MLFILIKVKEKGESEIRKTKRTDFLACARRHRCGRGHV